MSSADRVVFEIDPHTPQIARVTLSNAGRLNAITRSMWRELRELFGGLTKREPALRVVIVCGDAGQFAAGADLSEFPDFHFDAEQARAFHEEAPAPALRAMLDCDLPLVAQIEGVCVGGGLEIAACCDIRIAGASSRLGAPIAKLGFPMAPDELAILVASFGRATVTEMLIEARLYDASTALQRGVVHRVVADDAVRAEAESTAARIAALPPLALRINKQSLRQLAECEAGHFSDEQRAVHYRYASSEEHRDAVTKFLARR